MLCYTNRVRQGQVEHGPGASGDLSSDTSCYRSSPVLCRMSPHLTLNPQQPSLLSYRQWTTVRPSPPSYSSCHLSTW